MTDAWARGAERSTASAATALLPCPADTVVPFCRHAGSHTVLLSLFNYRLHVPHSVGLRSPCIAFCRFTNHCDSLGTRMRTRGVDSPCRQLGGVVPFDVPTKDEQGDMVRKTRESVLLKTKGFYTFLDTCCDRGNGLGRGGRGRRQFSELLGHRVDGSVGWSVVWSVGRLVGPSVTRSYGRWVGWRVCGFVGWWVGGLVD